MRMTIRSYTLKGTLIERMRAHERREIAHALVLHDHNQTHAAKWLCVSRRTLLFKIAMHNLTRSECMLLAGACHPGQIDD